LSFEFDEVPSFKTSALRLLGYEHYGARGRGGRAVRFQRNRAAGRLVAKIWPSVFIVLFGIGLTWQALASAGFVRFWL